MNRSIRLWLRIALAMTVLGLPLIAGCSQTDSGGDAGLPTGTGTTGPDPGDTNAPGQRSPGSGADATLR